MSLDVYLEGEPREASCVCSHCLEPHKRTQAPELYSANITHNLGGMASAAGIYRHLWRPDELSITRAAELIEPLERGLERLRALPDHFRKYDPSNGWGDYNGLVRFVANYLDACRAHPEAHVKVSR